MSTTANKDEVIPSANEIYGLIWPPWVTQQTLDILRNYEVRDDDVMVAAFPKSGTNWVREIVSLIHVNGKVEDINRDQTCSSLEFENPPRKVQIHRQPVIVRAQTWTSPRVLETHVVEEFLPKQLKQGKGKVIYVIRNPKDVVVSDWHFLKGLPVVCPSWEVHLNDFIEGKNDYGPWYTHVKEYWERHKNSKNVLILYYEDIKQDHRGGVVEIANFLGHPLSEEAIDKIVEHSSFKGMSRTHHKHDSNSSESEKRAGPPGLLRKGIVGDWKDRFTVRQNEMFDSVYKKELEGSGIKVEYE